jgi:DNA-binding response OmpR family regulator
MNDLKKNVLIVDDEPNIIMSLDFLIRKAGYGLFIARNGAEAMDTLEKEVPDLVILDIMLPDIDGYEVCKHIKSSPKHEHTKVVFLSAKSKQSDIDKGLNMGADLYVTKPFSTRHLMKEVETLLSKES